MTPASAPPSSDPISTAFAGPTRAVMVEADELASRIANKLGKHDTPEAVRATFQAAGFDEAAAADDVQRHREIIEARQIVAAAGPAREECHRIDAKIKGLVAELEKTTERIEAELKNLSEARLTPDLYAKRESLARRDLRTKLLPRYVQTELQQLSAELRTLTPAVQRLERMTPFREVAVDKTRLNDITSARRRQDEVDRIKLLNSENQASHLALRHRLQQSKLEAERLQEQAERLRARYLP